MKPIIKLANKIIEQKELAGTYTYIEESAKPAIIVVSKNSPDINNTYIHECIHHTLIEMKKDTELEKLAHRISRREDFINALAANLGKDLKFNLTEK